MNRYAMPRRLALTWRVFAPGAAAEIRRQQRTGRTPCCPCCGDLLEAQPDSRLCAELPLDARAYDLNCRGCRLFMCVVQHTRRSIRLVRMRRFVAAVRAVRLAPTGSATALPA
jgi:hypothetical protein